MPRRLIYSDAYCADIGDHVFPMRKFGLTRQLLLELGRATADDFETPTPASDAQVLAVHTPRYVRRVRELALRPEEIRILEIPLHRELVHAFWLVAGGTVLACRRAVETGFAANLAGGFHHAHADHGEGFCLLNDVAIGARAMLDEGWVERVAVLDLDVHQGNGTAAIFAREPRVFTCSLHQEDLYPLPKSPGDLDIGLPGGTGGAEYLAALEPALDATLAAAPDLVVYVAGADPYARDQLGGLELTIDDLGARDRRVFERCAAASVPVAVVPAGGYAVEVFDTVSIHVQTLTLGLRQASRGGATQQPGTAEG
jgi:acetoin utilization deacetylase AcuC-like enzyme